MTVPLDQVQSISVQFHYNSTGLTPIGVRRVPYERMEEMVARNNRNKNSKNSNTAFNECSACSILELVTGLTKTGYYLFDATVQQRYTDGDPRQPYQALIYRFRRCEKSAPRIFQVGQETALLGLKLLATGATWNTKGFINFQNNQHAINVLCHGREVLIDQNGTRQEARIKHKITMEKQVITVEKLTEDVPPSP